MAQFAMCSRASMYQTSLTLAEPAGITTPTSDAMAAQLGDGHMKKPVSGSPFVCFEFHWPGSPPAAPQCKRFHHTPTQTLRLPLLHPSCLFTTDRE
jgi:hypothetical protein